LAIAKWWKIDFHTHTPASTSCFIDQKIKAADWVKAAINAGLDGVVITDHNSAEWIEKIREAAEEIKISDNKNLVVYPGVELCVSLQNIHIIIIFDPITKGSIIKNFITECGIKDSDLGNTLKSVSEEKLGQLVKDYDILVIPAHFNKNKGLGRELNINGIKGFTRSIPIDAIEVRDETDINEVKNKVEAKAFESYPAMITGSDNPGTREGEHAVEGLGKAYTWIKLSEHSLESLRIAFLDTSRIIRVFNKESGIPDPNFITHSYISGMIINNLKHVDNLDFRFSPHLNCVIGGRATGKSTIIEMIRMTLGRIDEKNLKVTSLIAGVTQEESTIEVYYNFGSSKEFKVTVKGKKNREWIYEDSTGMIQEYPEFPVMVFSQKEIYNLVDDDENPEKKDRSPILEIIDDSIKEEKNAIDTKIDQLKRKALDLSLSLRSLRGEMEEIPRIKGAIEVANSKLELFKSSGIIQKKEMLDSISIDFKLLEGIIENIQNTVSDIDNNIINNLNEPSEQIMNKIKDDFSKQMGHKIEQSVGRIKSSFGSTLELAKKEIIQLQTELESSELKKKLDIASKEYSTALEKLQGLDVEQYKVTETERQNLLNRYKELLELQPKEPEIIKEIEKILDEIDEQWRKLFDLRMEVIKSIETKAKNIGLNIYFMSHSNRWLSQLRKDIGRTSVFENEFDAFKSWLFPDNMLNQERWKVWCKFLLINDRKEIAKIMKDGTKELFSDKFGKMWDVKYNDKTLSSIFSIHPEDRVQIKIKSNGTEIGINDGSPGQKCAAILAFIMNQGIKPLVIDQPEDDLDNSLIISLIVENIRNMKNNRQIIIVTHNPNIPVLGDAEGIIMLDRDTEGKVIFKDGKKTGCIEEKTIKKGICNIMEGGIEAFKRRGIKYKNI
jgi:hypothetical protein